MPSPAIVTADQLSAGDRERVLRFVNEASSAAAIASHVEFPHELDIGLRLAGRILDHRARIGGRFDSVHQLLEVPLIGPERFTELVSAILGWPLVNGGDDASDLRLELARMRLELRALRDRLAGPRLHIVPVLEGRFVGQPCSFLIRVTDPISAAPVVDAAVWVQADWGVLAHHRDFTAESGRAIEVRTDIDGQATVVLNAPPTEQLRVEEGAALETALELLDADARIPERNLPALARFVDSYRNPRNEPLRAAVDAFFAAAQERLEAVRAFENALHAWPQQSASVRALILGEGGSVTAEAMHVARF
jgi:hypothetical protein